MGKFDWGEAVKGLSHVVNSMTQAEAQRNQVLGQMAQQQSNWMMKKQEMDYKQELRGKDPYLQLQHAQLDQRQQQATQRVEAQKLQEQQLGEFTADYLKMINPEEFHSPAKLMYHLAHQLKIHPRVLAANERFQKNFAELYPEEVEEVSKSTGFNAPEAVGTILKSAADFVTKGVPGMFQNWKPEEAIKNVSEFAEQRQREVAQKEVNPRRVDVAVQQIQAGGEAALQSFLEQAPQAIEQGYMTHAEFDAIMNAVKGGRQ